MCDYTRRMHVHAQRTYMDVCSDHRGQTVARIGGSRFCDGMYKLRNNVQAMGLNRFGPLWLAAAIASLRGGSDKSTLCLLFLSRGDIFYCPSQRARIVRRQHRPARDSRIHVYMRGIFGPRPCVRAVYTQGAKGLQAGAVFGPLLIGQFTRHAFASHKGPR